MPEPQAEAPHIGRPLKFESVEELEKRIEAYFKECDREEDTRVFKHGKEKKLLQKINMERTLQVPVVVANGVLYINTGPKLFAIAAVIAALWNPDGADATLESQIRLNWSPPAVPTRAKRTTPDPGRVGRPRSPVASRITREPSPATARRAELSRPSRSILGTDVGSTGRALDRPARLQRGRRR